MEEELKSDLFRAEIIQQQFVHSEISDAVFAEFASDMLPKLAKHIAHLQAILDNQWEDIETAPKDGTVIIAYFPNVRSRRKVFSAYWHQPGNPLHPGYWVRDGQSGAAVATLWKRFPVSPATLGKEG